MGESSVSISTTSAIVYVVSGLVFFFLVFLLVMMGVTNCDWECCESCCCCCSCGCCCTKKKQTKPVKGQDWTFLDLEARSNPDSEDVWFLRLTPRKMAESIPAAAPRPLRKNSCDSVIQMTFWTVTENEVRPALPRHQGGRGRVYKVTLERESPWSAPRPVMTPDYGRTFNTHNLDWSLKTWCKI